MGSLKSKINNNKKKKKENTVNNELIALKKKMKEQYAAEEYVEALDTMAEIAQHKKMDPEIMFMGATCYFMTGDYERSVNWINNTLTYDPQNVGARILLSRICILQDNLDQGLKILDFVAANQQSAISGKDREDLEKILKYYIANMRDGMAKYPYLVAYYEEHCSNTEKKETEAKNERGGKDKAKAAVDRLKALLNKSKGQKNNQQTMQETSDASTSMHEPISDVITDNTIVKESNDTVTEFMDKVIFSNISMREKIKTLNNYASGLYLNDDYAGALTLLKKALEMDSGDPFVLRNIAYVCVALKDKEKALAFAKALPMLDFALLKSIKEL